MARSSDDGHGCSAQDGGSGIPKQQAHAGVQIRELCRKHGITEQTFVLRAPARTDGRSRVRCFTLVDDFTRECPSDRGGAFPAGRVIQALDRVAMARGLPRSVVRDHGPEFAGKALDRWAHERGGVAVHPAGQTR
ncbi:MAG: hypothetical protein IT361_11300 [Gemmatimonadaceae bacterium]|nr:hypothetical protein [Gemmatimonadaceae bacterium]